MAFSNNRRVTLESARTALGDRVRASVSVNGIDERYPNYVKKYEDNLVPGVEPWMFLDELSRGHGSELQSHGDRPPKFHAAHSSSALVVNSFARWKLNSGSLYLAGLRGVENFGFEYRCPTGLRSRRPANLDLVAKAGCAVLAVESKCIEFLRPKKAEFAAQYGSAIRQVLDRPWPELFKILEREPRHFECVDAAQLVKHCLGLRNTFRNQSITLLYLFWEPTNASDFKIFKKHHNEIKEFSKMVGGSKVRFRSISYAKLWRNWQRLDGPRWLGAHLANLRARYEVSI
jgi:hypothetical protein